MQISPLKFISHLNNTKSNSSNPIKKEEQDPKLLQNRSYDDLSMYPNAAYSICNFNFGLLSIDTSQKYTTSQKRFYETIEKNLPLRMGHFEDFLGDKQKILPENFFVNMKHYKKDLNWAKDTQNLVYFISNLIDKRVDFVKILNTAAFGVNYINDKDKFGVLKTSTPWTLSPKGYTIEKGKRGEEYFEKYSEKIKKPYTPKASYEYKDRANVSTIYPSKKAESFLILYPDYEMSNDSNLTIAKEIYNELTSKENPSKKEVVETAAKIQWLIAQETPYSKGSDSVANVLTRSIMHSYHLPIYPLKEGISLDFEAWYQDMDKYVRHYHDYFDKNT